MKIECLFCNYVYLKKGMLCSALSKDKYTVEVNP